MGERLTVIERHGLGIATVMPRRTAHRDRLADAIGCPLPDGPRRTSAGQLSMIGTGPGSMLAVMEGADPDWATELQTRTAGMASLSDQSGGYVLFRFSGPDAPALLQRGVAIDLHLAAFPVRSVAVSVIAHIGVILWRVDEACFDVAVFRSYADSLRHWIDTTRNAHATGQPDDR